jgi:trans-AT polyketide synthase, acyltransferase and oxidoreductase domains
MVIPLKTSGAFHSRYMAEAKKEFSIFLEQFKFVELKVPVISNINARPYKQIDIKQNLVEQITNPVKWTECIRYLMGLGGMEFEEIGPGKILTGLVRRISKESEPLVISSDEEVNNFLKDTNQILKEEAESDLKKTGLELQKPQLRLLFA